MFNVLLLFLFGFYYVLFVYTNFSQENNIVKINFIVLLKTNQIQLSSIISYY